MKNRVLILLSAIVVACGAGAQEKAVDISPANWPAGEYERFMAAQDVDRHTAGTASGYNGAVTVAYSGLAARAGLEALKQGGNALDAAMTSAMAQITLTAGSPISFFGMMSLVYYDAKTDTYHSMNAEWNTVKGETDPMTIPGGISFAADGSLQMQDAPSGRSALVGGFLKGVGAAHARFGKLPFDQLFVPSIYMAENGIPVTRHMAAQIAYREKTLSRLPETRAIFTGPDGELLGEGDILKQPALAKTLRAVGEKGTDYIYKGPWAERLVAAVQADGGKMTLEDLASYEVIWDEALSAEIGGGYVVHTNPWPNAGGVALIEAQKVALAADITADGHFTESAASLKKALDISSLGFLARMPPELREQSFPGLDLSPDARITTAHAELIWERMQEGARAANWQEAKPKHSDDVVVIDKDGNIAAITHTINTVYWGSTGIFVDGISISDAASFQQAKIAQLEPGSRIPSVTETGILSREGKPVLGFASMGSGLHQRTFQGLLNFTLFDMSVEDAVNTADFFMPGFDGETGENIVQVPEGRFDPEVLEGLGVAYREIPFDKVRLGGEGKWVAISKDPETGRLEAASHNRNNSDAVAY